MNELLHKFKLGNDAELLLEKRGGGFEKVATVPVGSQALGATTSDQGVEISAGGVFSERRSVSAAPVILVPSGSFTSTTGAFTLGTALGSVPNGVIPGGGNAFVALPAGAGGLVAGIYAATFSSTTAGQLVGNPATTAGAYTQSTGQVSLAQINVPANALGTLGSFEIDVVTSNNNSAGLKTLRGGINATSGIIYAQAGTTQGLRVSAFVQNRGAANSNVISNQSSVYGIVGAPAQGAFDTSVDWAFVISGQLAVATDWMVLELFKATIKKVS